MGRGGIMFVPLPVANDVMKLSAGPMMTSTSNSLSIRSIPWSREILRRCSRVFSYCSAVRLCS